MSKHYGCILLLGFAIAGMNSGEAGDLGGHEDQPNIVVIFTDDLGYGDLGSFGHPTIQTPHLDRLAAEGMKLTSFYVASSVCTPSRAALLTGRLPVRSGMSGDAKRRVLYPHHEGGLPANEVTLAEAMQEAGYATGCIGKWHLGVGEEHIPNSQGFDYYYGLLYSNDMNIEEGRHRRSASMNPNADPAWYDIPLYRNRDIIERPVDQNTLTKRYTEESVKFIRENRNRSFFLYLAHSMPHVPLFASAAFKDRSVRGRYGDTIEEIDGGVGAIIQALREEGLAEKTLLIFTSDNGPWLRMEIYGGSAGLLRDGKGGCWEGGFRVPAIAWWPGRIEAGAVCSDMMSTMDLWPTLVGIAGAKVPEDRVMDGIDMSATLLGKEANSRQLFYFYRGNELYAVRKGSYKAHFKTWDGYSSVPTESHDPPLLFNLDKDPSEMHNIAAGNETIVRELVEAAEQHTASVVPGEPQFYTLSPVWDTLNNED
jgi:arylsulfatase A-like enzyme